MRSALRRRAMHWLWRNQDDWPERLLDSRVYEWATDAFARVGCWIAGHEPIRDQCLKPEHDFCPWCRKSMPGQALARLTRRNP